MPAVCVEVAGARDAIDEGDGSCIAAVRYREQTMWVKKTPQEMSKERWRQFRNNFLIGLGVAALPGILWATGIRKPATGPSREVTGDVFLNRLAIVLLAAPAAGLVWACLWTCLGLVMRPSIVICPRCETRKRWDRNVACPCGGTFVWLAEMKWVEDATDKIESG